MSMMFLFRINAIVKAEHRTKINPLDPLMDLEPFKDLTGVKLYKICAVSNHLLDCHIDWDDYWECNVDKRIAVPNIYQIETGELQISGDFNSRYFFDWIYFMKFVFRELFEKITFFFWIDEGSFNEHGIYDGDFDEGCEFLLNQCLEYMQEDWTHTIDDLKRMAEEFEDEKLLLLVNSL